MGDKAWRTFRWLGFFIPLILLGYNFFLTVYPHYGSVIYAGDTAMLLVATWLVLAIFMLRSDAASPLVFGLYLVLYHLFAPLYILTVAGVNTPIALLWVLLATAAYILFSNRGMLLSLLVLLFSLLTYRTVAPATGEVVLYDLITVGIICLISLACAYLVWLQEVEKKNLLRIRKGERHQRNSIETLINNIADAVVSVEPNGKIALYNAAVLNLLDTNSDIGGQAIDKALHLEDEEGRPLKLVPTLKKSKAMVVDDNFYTRIAGERVRLEITYSPIRSAYRRSLGQTEGDGYVVIFRDVTKVKSLEEERDEFISVVSHELRTPVAIAEGALDNARLILKRGGQPETVESTLDTAYNQIVFLSRMVNDLSTLSRAERGLADKPEAIDASELAHALYKEYAPEAKEKKLKFNLDIHGKPGHVFASRLYLEELLQNFITNAIKYTKVGEVKLCIEKKEGEIYFAVRDTGVGISKADQEKVFEKFYRAEDYRTRETNGTGLGLYVSRKLARKLGCEIVLESRLNHGSTFSFSLPATQEEATTSSE